MPNIENFKLSVITTRPLSEDESWHVGNIGSVFLQHQFRNHEIRDLFGKYPKQNLKVFDVRIYLENISCAKTLIHELRRNIKLTELRGLMIELDIGNIEDLGAVRRDMFQLKEEMLNFERYIKNIGDPKFEEYVTKVEHEWHKGSNFEDFDYLIN